MNMKPFASLIAACVLSIVGFAGLPGSPGSDRPDCPGKIVCPRTGGLICRDRCPTVDPDRPDCPGRIVCPLTGQLVCVDRCPVKNTAAGSPKGDAKSSCCRSAD